MDKPTPEHLDEEIYRGKHVDDYPEVATPTGEPELLLTGVAKLLYFIRTSTAKNFEGSNWDRCKNKKLWLSNADMILAKVRQRYAQRGLGRPKLEGALGQLDLHLTYDGHLSAKDIDQILVQVEQHYEQGLVYLGNLKEFAEQKRLGRPCPSCLGTGCTTFNTEEGWHNKCPTCKGTGKVGEMDRPDREQIAEQAYTSYTLAVSGTIGLDWCPSWADLTEQHKQEWRSVAKGLLPLIPDEEEIRKRYYIDLDNIGAEIEEAKRGVVVRIQALISDLKKTKTARIG